MILAGVIRIEVDVAGVAVAGGFVTSEGVISIGVAGCGVVVSEVESFDSIPS